MTEFIWVEKYRPKTIQECILPERLKNTLKTYVQEGKVPNILLEGGPGTGKTTAARALCNEIGVSYIIINSSKNRGIDSIRTEIVSFASSKSFNQKSKVIIMDEVDFMTPEAQGAFRGVIEEFSSNCTFILTCNFKNKLMDAIHSRMATISFRFNPDERKKLSLEMFKRCQEILNEEKVEFDPRILATIIERYYPDFRKTIGELQRFSKGGLKDSSVLDQMASLRNVSDLLEHMKSKNFGKVRAWVTENGEADPVTVFRRIYDSLYGSLEPISIPVAIIILAKYQYQHAFVADPEINLVACLVELMMEAKFK